MILATVMLVQGAGLAFAWHSSLSGTTLSPASSVVKGTSVTDTATVGLNPGSTCTPISSCGPFGSVTFLVYKDTAGGPAGCVASDLNGATSYSSTVTITSAMIAGTSLPSTATVPSAALSTGSLAAGFYVFLVHYTGTGSSGYPDSPTAAGSMIVQVGTTYYLCEPLAITPASTSAPEFSLGLLPLFALVVPALLLMRGRFAAKTRMP
jgi:hypothetical protein